MVVIASLFLPSTLDLADRFDDPSFFEQSCHDVDADPAVVADIAERMGRPADVRHWLTIAAENGDTDAMLQLIEEYDHGDLQRCWTWVYLSQLVGTDLSQDAHYAINEDGSDYDDDVGGPLYVAGRDGVDLEPLAPEQDTTARLAAQKLFEQIEPGQSIGIFIGPEGGFTPEEIELAMNHQVQPITLGKRILRTETAGMAVLSVLMFQLEGRE